MMRTMTREQRIAREAEWENRLNILRSDMEEANGDESGDNVEALVRVAWTLLYEARTKRERGGYVT